MVKQPDHECEMTVQQVLNYLEDGAPLPEDIETVLDRAQNEILAGESNQITVLITIRK